MERVNHAAEAIRLIDATLLEEEIILQGLRDIVGSSRTSEEVDAELRDWKLYAKA